MKTVFEVRVRRDGQITLPKELRDRMGTESMLTLQDLGNGALLLTRSHSSVSEIADKLAREWQAAGMSLEDMLAELRQMRKERDAQDS